VTLTAQDRDDMRDYLRRFEEPESPPARFEEPESPPARFEEPESPPPCAARRFSAEHRAKIAAALRGRRLSAEVRAKMSAAHRRTKSA
jgi:NUMOD3 motif-containing protein